MLRGRSRSRPVVVDFLHIERVLLNEVAAGFDFFAHQAAEHLLGLNGVLERDAHQGAFLGIERGFPEFAAVHFAEALEAGDGHAAFAVAANLADQFA